jgi:hypothetical protein
MNFGSKVWQEGKERSQLYNENLKRRNQRFVLLLFMKIDFRHLRFESL